MYDYYDYGGPSFYWWMLSYGYLLTVLVYGGIFFYLFPFLQAIFQHQNKAWLKTTLDNSKSIDAETKAKILAEATPEFDHPLYKLTKLQYLISGIITTIIGLLVLVLHEPSEGVIKSLVFLPLLVGAGVNALYFTQFKNVGLWKSAAGFFGVLGICITIPGVFAVYEWDWMRSDLLVYISLALSLALVHVLESTIASLLYIVMVAFGSAVLTANISDNWMYFFKSFIWIFALAPLVYWMPKLKSAKSMGVKEIAFGTLFMLMIITVTFTNLERLASLGLVIILPILYMFSKIHFKQDGWFVTKPIQSLIVLGTFYGIVALNIPDAWIIFKSFDYQFGQFGFSILVDYFVIIAMIFGAIMMFRDNFEESLDKINLIVLGFPIAAYILSFLSDYYAYYLFIPVLAGYGVFYLQKGIENKNPFTIILGGMGVLAVLPVIYQHLPNDILREQWAIGILITLYGASMLGMALYLRSQWAVTDEQDELPPQPNNQEVLDDVSI